MNKEKLTIEIPKGYYFTQITKEYSIGENHYVDLGLIKESEMCKIRQPHSPCDKCDKDIKIIKGAKKFAEDFEGVMKDLSKE